MNLLVREENCSLWGFFSINYFTPSLQVVIKFPKVLHEEDQFCFPLLGKLHEILMWDCQYIWNVLQKKKKMHYLLHFINKLKWKYIVSLHVWAQMTTQCTCFSFSWFWPWLYLLYLFSYGHVKLVSCSSQLVITLCLFVYEYVCRSSMAFSWTVLMLRYVCLHRVGWTLKRCVIDHNSWSRLLQPHCAKHDWQLCPQQTSWSS